MLNTIDINMDLGEGSGRDSQLMPLISSCSIACGGHYGNEKTMRETIILAKKYNVKIGAHPSFPDKKSFGRIVLTMNQQELSESIYYQLMQFFTICNEEEIPVSHIKLHGALYNYAAKDEVTANAVIEAITSTKVIANLFVPYNSIIAEKAKNIFPLLFEAFIDRRYNDDLSLVSRAIENAVIASPEDAWKQLYDMISTNMVVTTQKNRRKIIASTYCIHGDNENSLEILQYIRLRMKEYKIRLL